MTHIVTICINQEKKIEKSEWVLSYRTVGYNLLVWYLCLSFEGWRTWRFENKCFPFWLLSESPGVCCFLIVCLHYSLPSSNLASKRAKTQGALSIVRSRVPTFDLDRVTSRVDVQSLSCFRGAPVKLHFSAVDRHSRAWRPQKAPPPAFWCCASVDESRYSADLPGAPRFHLTHLSVCCFPVLRSGTQPGIPFSRVP